MAKSNFEKIFIDRLTMRTTDQIIIHWKANYIQDDDLLLSEPLEETLKSIKSNLPSDVSQTSSFSSQYLFNQVMKEYIISTYKAFAILRSIVRDISHGQQTYSEISSYLVNMLLAKSICLLLGVWYSHNHIRLTNSNEEFFVIDLFHKKANSYESRIFNIKKTRLTHSQFWKMFLEILKNTSGTLISSRLSIFINNIDHNDFSLIRNHLQYSYINWIFEDLQSDDILETDWFTNYSYDFNLDFKILTNNSNKLLSLELIKFNSLLFKEIAVHDELKDHFNNFEEIASLFKNWMN